MNILITGGLGFIGSHLEPALQKKGHYVTIMDRIRINRPDYYRGDICDYSRMEYIFDQVQPDLVIHLAAMVSRKESEETPYMAIQTNVDGTLNVVLLCLKHNARLIYAGSSEEYGTAFDEYEYVDEDIPFGHPTSIYAMTKRMSEEVIQYYATFKGLTATTCRFFMLYGPGEAATDYRSAMIRFIDAAKKGEDIVAHKGTMRQWCYIDDAVEAIARIVQQKYLRIVGLDYVGRYNVYNIGRDEKVSAEMLARLVKRAIRSKSKIVLTEPEETIIPVKLASFDKARMELGWKAETTLEDGLKKVVEEYK